MEGNRVLKSSACFKTENGRKYLVQLCKHFAHKIEVSYDENHGDCQFPCGKGRLDADDNGLLMHVEAATTEDLERAQAIIETHLIRFAFREKLETLEWQRLKEAA